MRNGAFELTFGGSALRVGMNPLMVKCSFCELIDLRLGNFYEWRDARRRVLCRYEFQIL